ncbi:hypothetical protein [Gordonia phage Tarzan]|uniref:Uncharacterized protein n=1 Tax=Gordonia phage Tarzan TaxID=3038367 RepID=A0AAF0GFD5_9CAUD|nr:hypothetical protein QLQ76_gp41 [Gordonia phage Tarzan]WGH20075.1 hypothetical protein [Gordonia phage Tarzan]
MTAPIGDAGGLLDLDPVAAGLRAVDEVVTEIRAFGYGFVRLAEADRRIAERLANRDYRFLGEL